MKKQCVCGCVKHLPAFQRPQPFKKLNYLPPALLHIHSTFVLTGMKQQAIFTASTLNISSPNVLFATSVPAFLSCDLVINVIWVMSEDKTSTLENETCNGAPTGHHTSHEQQCS